MFFLPADEIMTHPPTHKKRIKKGFPTHTVIFCHSFCKPTHHSTLLFAFRVDYFFSGKKQKSKSCANAQNKNLRQKITFATAYNSAYTTIPTRGYCVYARFHYPQQQANAKAFFILFFLRYPPEKRYRPTKRTFIFELIMHLPTVEQVQSHRRKVWQSH